MSPSNKRDSCSPACSRFRLQEKSFFKEKKKKETRVLLIQGLQKMTRDHLKSQNKDKYNYKKLLQTLKKS